MSHQFPKHRFLATLFVVGLTLFTVGQVFAWEYDRPYAVGLYGTSTGKTWSPYQGRLRGDVGYDNANERATQPLAQYVRWNWSAINWMRANNGSISITFHSSFDGNTGPSAGCDNYWYAQYWASTDLPGASATVFPRSCGFTKDSEIRIYGDKYRLYGDVDYFAQSWYKERYNSGEPKGQFNVDTYWGSSENYHQKYCVRDNGYTAVSC
jgi:hypothetical protein